jgi:site-specific DNA recombinase
MSRNSDLLDVYGRVSALGDARQRSTTGQAADCIARIHDRGARVGEVHIDEGRSAWNPKVKRPAWERLMERLHTRVAGGVVVFDLARFSRRPSDGEPLIKLAEGGLIVLDSEGEYDLTTASGKKAFRDQLTNAAYESDRLSTRVKRGKKLKAERGESNRCRRPYGYGMDWKIIPQEATILRELVRRLLDGVPINELCRELNARQIPTSVGGIWSNAGIRQIVLRPINAGLSSYRGQVVGPMSDVDPIVSREDWERISAQFAARRRGAPQSPTYLASGIAACEQCGFRLSGIPKAAYRPYPDGTVARHYYCHIRDGVRGGCGKTSVDQRALDLILRRLVVTILSDPRHSAAIADAERQTGQQIREIEDAIDECERLGIELAARLGRGEMSQARHDAAVGPLDRRLAVLRQQQQSEIATRRTTGGGVLPAGTREEWEARWDAALTHHRRALLRQALGGRVLVVGPPVDGRLRSDPTGRVRIVG